MNNNPGLTGKETLFSPPIVSLRYLPNGLADRHKTFMIHSHKIKPPKMLVNRSIKMSKMISMIFILITKFFFFTNFILTHKFKFLLGFGPHNFENSCAKQNKTKICGVHFLSKLPGHCLPALKVVCLFIGALGRAGHLDHFAPITTFFWKSLKRIHQRVLTDFRQRERKNC